MKTLFLSIGHNDGKNWVQKLGKWVKSLIGDKGAVGNGTSEYAVVKAVVDAIKLKGNISGVQYIIKVPEGLNLDERIKWINANIAKYPEPFAFEFHLDSATPTAR
jgi:hypothetical protein